MRSLETHPPSWCSYLFWHLQRKQGSKMSNWQRVKYGCECKSLPHKWKIQWWGIWLQHGAASSDLSASEPPQLCRVPALPRGRPLRTAAAGIEGWSKMCLENALVSNSLLDLIHFNNQKGKQTPAWKISAATSRAAPHPATLVDWHRPALSLVTRESIRG